MIAASPQAGTAARIAALRAEMQTLIDETQRYESSQQLLWQADRIALGRAYVAVAAIGSFGMAETILYRTWGNAVLMWFVVVLLAPIVGMLIGTLAYGLVKLWQRFTVPLARWGEQTVPTRSETQKVSKPYQSAIRPARPQ